MYWVEKKGREGERSTKDIQCSVGEVTKSREAEGICISTKHKQADLPT